MDDLAEIVTILEDLTTRSTLADLGLTEMGT